ncbi:Hypothetical predicted protein [Scomber scombrus]|uniref:Uncharacterized protein n=1 Tax=Scomber scombrus TaxID=13677 RepID=A0AAV1MWA6_SCOSC
MLDDYNKSKYEQPQKELKPKRKRILNGVVILYAELRRDTFQTVISRYMAGSAENGRTRTEPDRGCEQREGLLFFQLLLFANGLIVSRCWRGGGASEEKWRRVF